MSAQVIEFPRAIGCAPTTWPCRALYEVALDSNASHEEAIEFMDWVLASLWVYGFKVVPLGDDDQGDAA
jgi:hypothetical protein